MPHMELELGVVMGTGSWNLEREEVMAEPQEGSLVTFPAADLRSLSDPQAQTPCPRFYPAASSRSAFTGCSALLLAVTGAGISPSVSQKPHSDSSCAPVKLRSPGPTPESRTSISMVGTLESGLITRTDNN